MSSEQFDNTMVFDVAVLTAQGTGAGILGEPDFQATVGEIDPITPLEVRSLLPEERAPLSLVMLVDVTDTMSPVLVRELASLVNALNNPVNFPDAEIAVIPFSDQIEVNMAFPMGASEFSSDFSSAAAAIQAFEVRPIRPDANVIINAVSAGVNLVQANQNPTVERDYVILLVTDAADTSIETQESLTSIVQNIQQSGVRTFSITLPELAGQRRLPDVNLAGAFVGNSGHLYQYAAQTSDVNAANSHLANSINSFIDALQSQYEVRFDLTNRGITNEVRFVINALVGGAIGSDSTTIRYIEQIYDLRFANVQDRDRVTGIVDLTLQLSEPLPQDRNYTYQFYIQELSNTRADPVLLPCGDASQPTCLWDTTTAIAPGFVSIGAYVVDSNGIGVAQTSPTMLNVYRPLDVIIPEENIGVLQISAGTIGLESAGANLLQLYAGLEDETLSPVASTALERDGQTILSWDSSGFLPVEADPGTAFNLNIRVDVVDSTRNILIARFEGEDISLISSPEYTVELNDLQENIAISTLVMVSASLAQTPIPGDYLAIIELSEAGQPMLLACVEDEGTSRNYELNTSARQPGSVMIAAAVLRGSCASGTIISLEQAGINLYNPITAVDMIGERNGFVAGNVAFNVNVADLPSAQVAYLYVDDTRIAQVAVDRNVELTLTANLDRILFTQETATELSVVFRIDVVNVAGSVLGRWIREANAIATPDYAIQIEGLPGVTEADSNLVMEVSGEYRLSASVNELLAEVGDQLALVEIIPDDGLNAVRGSLRVLEITPSSPLTYNLNTATSPSGLYRLGVVLLRTPNIQRGMTISCENLSFSGVVVCDQEIIASSTPILLNVFSPLTGVSLDSPQGFVGGEVTLRVPLDNFPQTENVSVYLNEAQIVTTQQAEGNILQLSFDLNDTLFDATADDSQTVVIRVDLQTQITQERPLVLARWESTSLTALAVPDYTGEITISPQPDNNQLINGDYTLTGSLSDAPVTELGHRLALVLLRLDDPNGGYRILETSEAGEAITFDWNTASLLTPGLYRFATVVIDRNDNLVGIDSLSEICESSVAQRNAGCSQVLNVFETLSSLQITPINNNAVSGSDVNISVNIAGIPGANTVIFRIPDLNGTWLEFPEAVSNSDTISMTWDVEGIYFATDAATTTRDVEVVAEVWRINEAERILLSRNTRNITVQRLVSYAVSFESVQGNALIDSPTEFSVVIEPEPVLGPNDQLIYFYSLGDVELSPSSSDGSTVTIDPSGFITGPGNYPLQVSVNLDTTLLAEETVTVRLVDTTSLQPRGDFSRERLVGRNTLEVDNYPDVTSIVIRFQPEGQSNFVDLVTPVDVQDSAITSASINLNDATIFDNSDVRELDGLLQIELRDAANQPLYRWVAMRTIAYDNSLPIWVVLLVGVVVFFAVGGVYIAITRDLRTRFRFRNNQYTTVFGDGLFAVFTPQSKSVPNDFVPLKNSKYMTVGRKISNPSRRDPQPDIAFASREISRILGRFTVRNDGRLYFIAQKNARYNVMINGVPLEEESSDKYNKGDYSVWLDVNDELGFGRTGGYRIRLISQEQLDDFMPQGGN
ncbi:MAG: hypothetical protein RLP44_10280 [Aggregatilineales bacterium]